MVAYHDGEEEQEQEEQLMSLNPSRPVRIVFPGVARNYVHCSGRHGALAET